VVCLKELAWDLKPCLSADSETKPSSSLTKMDASSCTRGFALVRLLFSIAFARLCAPLIAAYFAVSSI
jgi:hypothetical protein